MRALSRITKEWLIIFTYASLFVILATAGFMVVFTNRHANVMYDQIADQATTKMSLLLDCYENTEHLQNLTTDKVFHPWTFKKQQEAQLRSESMAMERNLEEYEKNITYPAEKEQYRSLLDN